MKQGVVPIRDLGKLLRTAAAKYRVLAPVRRGADVVLADLPADQEPVLAFPNFQHAPKGVFFPACELVCRFRGDDLAEVPKLDERILVFGVRPCDARALACLDKVFGEFGGKQDPYYLERRRNGLVITLACGEPRDTCFCTATGGDPGATEGADVAAFDLGDKVLFEARTDKGEAFLDSAGGQMAKAEPADLAARDRALAKAREKIRKMDLSTLKKKLEKSFDDPVWASVSDVCLGCGLCTYLCPTCHCFDITDEKDRQGGRRVRTWDSCQYPLFSLHASGHNPRPTRKERMRQRILHKFQYTVDNLGAVFCVGCGRCVVACPVNLDLREVLKTLQKL